MFYIALMWNHIGIKVHQVIFNQIFFKTQKLWQGICKSLVDFPWLSLQYGSPLTSLIQDHCLILSEKCLIIIKFWVFYRLKCHYLSHLITCNGGFFTCSRNSFVLVSYLKRCLWLQCRKENLYPHCCMLKTYIYAS